MFRCGCMLLYGCMLAQRLSMYLKQNHVINTSIQKAGISGFSGCLDYNSVICSKSANPDCNKRRERSSCLVPWSGQHLWIGPSFTAVDCLWFLPSAHNNDKSGKTLGSAVLPHNIRLHYNMATFGSRHYGGVHHLPLGLYDGNGDHHQSLKVGGRRSTTIEWSKATTNTSLYGWFNNTDNNGPLH